MKQIFKVTKASICGVCASGDDELNTLIESSKPNSWFVYNDISLHSTPVNAIKKRDKLIKEEVELYSKHLNDAILAGDQLHIDFYKHLLEDVKLNTIRLRYEVINMFSVEPVDLED